MTSGKGKKGRGYERMLLDSILSYSILLFDLSIGSFTASIALVWLQWEGVDG
jgi:hypothetical protein